MRDLVKTFNNSDTIQFISTLTGITGITLRDLNINKCYQKMKEIYQDAFEDKILDEEKTQIFLNSLGELEKYLNINENLDSKLFEELLKVSVNGVKIKDELTKEYIKTLSDMTFLDLKVFKIMFSVKTFIEEDKDDFCIGINNRNIYQIIDDYKGKMENIPIEFIEKSLNKLLEKNFIKESSSGEHMENTSKLELNFLTELGQKIIDLLI